MPFSIFLQKFKKKHFHLMMMVFFICFTSCKEKHYAAQNTDKELIENLINDAQKNRDTLQKPQISDSLLDEALKKSLMMDDARTNALSYIAILRFKNPKKISDENADELFRQATLNAKKSGSKPLVADAYFAMCEHLLQKNKPNEALNYLNLSSNSAFNSKKKEIKKLIIQSKINEELNTPFEQLRNLLDAHYLAMDIENDSLKNATLMLLSDFYFYQKKFEKALDYTNQMKENISSKKPVDSIAWYYAEENRLSILTQKIDNTVIPDIAVKIIKFGKQKNIPKLSWNAQSSLRTYYINNLEFNKINDWYLKNPDDLANLKIIDASYFYRVKAYLAEYNKKIDSAEYYQNLAGKYGDVDNPHFLYNYFLRKGEFFERNGNFKKAEVNYEKSFDNSLKTNNYFDQITLGEKIAAYYQKEGNISKSLYFLETIGESKNKLIKVLNNENVRDIELTNILAQKNLERQKSLEKIQEKHNTQYLLIALVIILVIMSMVVISLYKVPHWWIKSMGYISFIMFFEFIILLIDNWLHHLTHGDQIQILLSKIVIISILFPLHHWIEKTFVNILLNRKIRIIFLKLYKKLKIKQTTTTKLGE